ncbi:MAG: hypothetical protein KDB88_11955, partial [Flavobacteriales bacterium]|nr:hypothetical protein [Flavobacteriales bacterium]
MSPRVDDHLPTPPGELVPLDPDMLKQRIREMVGSWVELTGQWLGVHDLLLDQVVLVEGGPILGYASEDLLDKFKAQDMIPAEDLDRILELHLGFVRLIGSRDGSQRATDGVISLTLTHGLRRSDGTFARVQRHVMPIVLEADGRVRALLHLCRDISRLAPGGSGVRWSLQAPEHLNALFMDQVNRPSGRAW